MSRFAGEALGRALTTHDAHPRRTASLGALQGSEQSYDHALDRKTSRGASLEAQRRGCLSMRGSKMKKVSLLLLSL